MRALLEVQNISKDFPLENGRIHNVLADISFTLSQKETICILGESGCGKTTLLNILAGLTQPSSGNVTSDIIRPSVDVGYMTQGALLLSWRTVYENVSLGMEFHRFDKKKIKEQCAAYINLVGLSDFQGAYPDQLSGGMRQRAALARSLALEPKILFLDEPLGSLDVSNRRKLSHAIKSYIKEKSAGAIVVTHSVEEAVFLADRVLILSSSPAKIANSFDIKNTDSAFDAVMDALLNITVKENQDAA